MFLRPRVPSPARPLRRRTGRGRRLGALLVAATALAVLPAALPTPAAAAWQSSGRFPGLGNGHVWGISVYPATPSVLLAATDQGVYRSTDSGATWVQTQLKGVRAWTVGFDVRSPYGAYAGLDGKGVQRSYDQGQTWTDGSQGLGNLDVRSLAFGLEGIAAGTANGVDVSSDGAHWRGAGLDGYSIASIAVSANQPQLTLVAGVDAAPPNASGAGYLFRNAGGALQWEALQQGLPTSAVVSSVSAGPLPTTTTKGVYHSGDGGTTWTPSTGIPDQTSLTTSTYSPLDPNVAYAGADAGGSSGGVLMRSTDGGATFTTVADALPSGQSNVEALAVAGTSPPTVLVAVDPPSNNAAVYHGVDAGAPAPGGTGQDQAGAALSSAAPTAKPTPKPKARVRPTPAPAESTGLRHVVDVAVRFPFPLVLELLAVLLIVYLVMRWRQRYLDVEGPP